MPSTKERLSLFENVLTIQPKLHNANSAHVCVCVCVRFCVYTHLLYTRDLSCFLPFGGGKGTTRPIREPGDQHFSSPVSPISTFLSAHLQWWVYKRTPTHLPFYVGDVDPKSDPYVWHNSRITHWAISLPPKTLIFPQISSKERCVCYWN